MERSEALTRILKLGNSAVSLPDSEVFTAKMFKKIIIINLMASCRESTESVAMLATCSLTAFVLHELAQLEIQLCPSLFFSFIIASSYCC